MTQPGLLSMGTQPAFDRRLRRKAVDMFAVFIWMRAFNVVSVGNFSNWKF